MSMHRHSHSQPYNTHKNVAVWLTVMYQFSMATKADASESNSANSFFVCCFVLFCEFNKFVGVDYWDQKEDHLLCMLECWESTGASSSGTWCVKRINDVHRTLKYSWTGTVLPFFFFRVFLHIIKMHARNVMGNMILFVRKRRLI